MEKNKLIAEKKRSDFDERQAAAMVRAKEKGLELAAKVKQQADARKKKVDARVKVKKLKKKRKKRKKREKNSGWWSSVVLISKYITRFLFVQGGKLDSACLHCSQRLNDAGQILKDRINGIIKRGEDRSHFYSVVRNSIQRALFLIKVETTFIHLFP